MALKLPRNLFRVYIYSEFVSGQGFYCNILIQGSQVLQVIYKCHLSMYKALLVLLVDAVVGQVDEVVAQLSRVVGVLVRRKPDQLLERILQSLSCT